MSKKATDKKTAPAKNAVTSGKRTGKTPKTKAATTPAKGAAPAEPAAARKTTKTDAILTLLKQPGGTTITQLMDATGWQPHSVRGFLSGTIGKKMGLKLDSTRGEDGARIYALETK